VEERQKKGEGDCAQGKNEHYVIGKLKYSSVFVANDYFALYLPRRSWHFVLPKNQQHD
jgi:hypothetical protein